jgi:hypothetical protein
MSDRSLFSHFLRGRVPGQWVIQITDACNASCPQCEMRIDSSFARSRLDTDRIKRIIDRAAEQGVQAISFTGGEPFLHFETLLAAIRHASHMGIRYTRTGTNGFFLRGVGKPGWERRVTDVAERLAESGLYTMWISMDSAIPEVHEKMRGLEGVIDGIETALPIFHVAGLYPSVNLGINRNVGGWWGETSIAVRGNPRAFRSHFRRAFGSFYRRAIDMGFTIANACYPMSANPEAHKDGSAIYGASSSDQVVRFSKNEKALLYHALLQTVPDYRSRIRIFTPLVELYTLVRRYGYSEDIGYPCRGGTDYFFVDAREGETFPCGFRGREPLGKGELFDVASCSKDPYCTECDWECFRDPSDLFGPLIELRKHPVRLLARFRQHPDLAKFWWNDLMYARVCGYFSGRKRPEYTKMANTVYAGRRQAASLEVRLPSTVFAPSTA